MKPENSDHPNALEIKRRIQWKLDNNPDNKWIKAPNWLSEESLHRLREGKEVYAAQIQALVDGDRKVGKSRIPMPRIDPMSTLKLKRKDKPKYYKRTLKTKTRSVRPDLETYLAARLLIERDARHKNAVERYNRRETVHGYDLNPFVPIVSINKEGRGEAFYPYSRMKQ